MFRFAISADGSGNCTSETFQTLNLCAHRYYFANSRPEPRRTLAHFRWLRNELRFFSKLSYETSESWARMNMKSSDSREPISLLEGENLFLIITLDHGDIFGFENFCFRLTARRFILRSCCASTLLFLSFLRID